MPTICRLLKIKDETINYKITKGLKRMNTNKKKEVIKTGMDHMLRQEKMFAKKPGRKPDYYSKVMNNELFGLLIADHDTTSTTLLWAMKLLSAHPAITSRLRDSLYASYPTARTNGTVPTAHDIATITNHYLNTCIEEILRCGQTATIVSRAATQDATVLGHVIPKGTLVVFLNFGHGVLVPAQKIDDKLRSPNYHASNINRIGTWEAEGITDFNPDRWLVPSEDGKERVFDSNAGPHMLFGGGPRGCFGKRLAYMELRLALVLVLWHFKLGDVPEKYAGMEAEELLRYGPAQCYVRLENA